MSDFFTRAEHIEWCKRRAFEYVEAGDMQQAWASMASDLGKHPETESHIGIELGAMMLFAGFLRDPIKMREWIEGFR